MRLTPALLRSYAYRWETVAPTPAQLLYADRLFIRGPATRIWSSPSFREIPFPSAPEVAFIGRSNVGKSSLLNGLVGASPSAPLAFTSSKPGRTRLLNGFSVTANKLVLVDLPGYGYASRHLWGSQVYKYLSRRRTFCRAFLLIDAQHGIKPYDYALLEDFVSAGVSFQIVLSKADKVAHDDELLSRVDEVKNVLQAGFGDAAGGTGKMKGGLGEILVTAAGGTWTGKRARVVEGLRDVRWAAAVAAGLDMEFEVEAGLGMKVEAGGSD